MTTYSTNAEVLSDIKGSPALSATTDIKDTDLTGWREQERALIDSYLSNKYTLPITNAADLLILKKIEIDLCVYRYWKVKNITNLKDVVSGVGIQESREYVVYKEAKQWLQDVASGNIKLHSSYAAEGTLPLDVEPETDLLNKIREW